MDIVGFFAGRVTLCGAEACAVAVLEYVRGRSLSHCRICLEDGRFFATLSAREARLLRQFCEENGIEVSLAENRGFPALFDRYGKRVGLWIGALAVAVMLYACSCVVWDIRIVGNDRLDDGEVIEMLAQSGLSVGAYLGNFDNDAVESRLLREHREIGWVAINVRGTTANVEIVETVYGSIPSGAASDLVAARDGVIERIEVLDGDLRVKVGDVVREGEILAGGIYEGVGRLRTTRAQGQVYARTLREFEVEIPLEGVEKRYMGGEWREISINFSPFGNTPTAEIIPASGATIIMFESISKCNSLFKFVMLLHLIGVINFKLFALKLLTFALANNMFPPSLKSGFTGL